MNETLANQVLTLAEEIQQVASPTFEEKERSAFMKAYFNAQGANVVNLDDSGNVYVQVKGRGEKPPVIVSAHLDTVFPKSVNLALSHSADKIHGPGIGDNSLGLAGLMGLFWALNRKDSKPGGLSVPPGDVWLVANVGEEGLGNLTGMKAILEHFGKDISAYLVLEGMSLGQIYHRGLGIRRYGIKVTARGGHSWIDYGSPSAIHELAEVVVKLKTLPLPVDPRTTLNVGVISGGTSVNTIASEAKLQLDLRSTNSLALSNVNEQVEMIVREADRKGGEVYRVQAEVIGSRPAGEIPPDHPLVKLAVKCHLDHGVSTRLNIGSTDANIPLSMGLPAISIGLTSGGGGHTIGEYIDTKPVENGLAILVDLVIKVFQETTP